MTTNELNHIVGFLKYAADKMGNSSCNDLLLEDTP